MLHLAAQASNPVALPEAQLPHLRSREISSVISDVC